MEMLNYEDKLHALVNVLQSFINFHYIDTEDPSEWYKLQEGDGVEIKKLALIT